MTEVRVLQQISGAREDGSPYPEPGTIVEVPDEVAQELFRSRQAAPLAKKGAKRDPARQREQDKAQQEAEGAATQQAANAAHVAAAQARFNAEDARVAYEELDNVASDAEADAEELQAKADKGHGPGQTHEEAGAGRLAEEDRPGNAGNARGHNTATPGSARGPGNAGR